MSAESWNSDYVLRGYAESEQAYESFLKSGDVEAQKAAMKALCGVLTAIEADKVFWAKLEEFSKRGHPSREQYVKLLAEGKLARLERDALLWKGMEPERAISLVSRVELAAIECLKTQGAATAAELRALLAELRSAICEAPLPKAPSLKPLTRKTARSSWVHRSVEKLAFAATAFRGISFVGGAALFGANAAAHAAAHLDAETARQSQEWGHKAMTGSLLGTAG